MPTSANHPRRPPEWAGLNKSKFLRSTPPARPRHYASWQDVARRTGNVSLYGLVDLRHEFLDGTRVRVSIIKMGGRHRPVTSPAPHQSRRGAD